jgi:acetyl esterase/lipase
MTLGGKDAKSVVKENILYTEAGRRLDVYLPQHDAEDEHTSLAPVIVFVGGGNWTWWSKKGGAQAALRLRRLGYAVVVPDLRQWPNAKSPDMVSSERWTGVVRAKRADLCLPS